MSEERGITMSEFKTVVESFRTDMKKVTEVVQHGFARVDERFDKVEGRMDRLENRMDRMQGQMNQMQGQVNQVQVQLNQVHERVNRIDGRLESVYEQTGLLLEGQTEMKHELKNKVSYDEFNKLEKRVVRLERRHA
jgi:chromosome segregation ATPase